MPDTGCDYIFVELVEGRVICATCSSPCSTCAALYASLKGSYGAQNYDILAQFSSGANCA